MCIFPITESGLTKHISFFRIPNQSQARSTPKTLWGLSCPKKNYRAIPTNKWKYASFGGNYANPKKKSLVKLEFWMIQGADFRRQIQGVHSHKQEHLLWNVQVPWYMRNIHPDALQSWGCCFLWFKIQHMFGSKYVLRILLEFWWINLGAEVPTARSYLDLYY